MKECKHLLKYSSQHITCGKNLSGDDGRAHCGINPHTGEFVVYRDCPHYEPVEEGKEKMSIGEGILRRVAKRNKDDNEVAKKVHEEMNEDDENISIAEKARKQLKEQKGD